MQQYLQVYLDESEEELEGLVNALLRLEEDSKDRESLDEAFRLLHTLKGSAGMMGFEGVSELAHELENRFETFRTGSRTLTRATINVLLEGIDFFREFNAGLRRGEIPSGDGSHLIAKLAQIVDEPRVPPAQPQQPTLRAPTDLIERSEKTLAMEGAYRVTVHFQAGLQLADLKARLIFARLSQIGEIVATIPPIDDLLSVDDLSQFALVVLSERDQKDVVTIADVDGVASVEIEGASLLNAMHGSEQPSIEDEAPPSRTSSLSAPTVVAHDGAAQDDSQAFLQPGSLETDAEFELAADSESPESAPGSVLAVPSADMIPEATAPVSPSVGDTPAETKSMEVMPSTSNAAAAAPAEPTRSKVAETVRVDIDRLDRLMNLTGELVVTRARFTQIARDMSSLFRNRNIASRSQDLSERLRLGVQKLRQMRTEEQHTGNGWELTLRELEEDLNGLEEQSAIWDEGRRHFAQIAESVDQLNRVSSNLQHGVLETRMVPVAPLFNRFRRVIRDLSTERGKQVELLIAGEKTELDKRMIDELGDPLIHLVRNSIDHGLESADERVRQGKPRTGTITLEAFHSGNNVFIRVSDDGAGISVERVRERLLQRGIVTPAAIGELSEQEIVDYIWHPGFSTAEQVTDISGRGVGMDVVRRRITDLNGTIEIDSRAGKGTSFSIRLPLTLAIIRSLLVRFNDGVFSIPIDDVREIVAVPRQEIHVVHNHRTIDVRGEFIPLTSMNELFEWNRRSVSEGSPVMQQGSTAAAAGSVNVVILNSGNRAIGLRVDELLGGSDIVIKSLSDNFTAIRGLSGASVMGDGNVCLMLDTNAVVELAAERARPQATSGKLS